MGVADSWSIRAVPNNLVVSHTSIRSLAGNCGGTSLQRILVAGSVYHMRCHTRRNAPLLRTPKPGWPRARSNTRHIGKGCQVV